MRQKEERGKSRRGNNEVLLSVFQMNANDAERIPVFARNSRTPQVPHPREGIA